LESWFGDKERNERLESNHRLDGIKGKSFVSVIPEEILFEWADQDRAGRYPRLGWHIQMVAGNEDTEGEWTELALECLARSGNFKEMLDVFVSRIRPTSWSGSLADLMERRIGLLKLLEAEGDNETYLKTVISELEENMQSTRDFESNRRQREYLSFE